ncbi:MAG TPA: type I 3-dehydroquinate dehydratase, partial [Planctomycetota bacterium]|nr:type I 3-dehydroquinate dehydratase [Planctomycetota bacterium]
MICAVVRAESNEQALADLAEARRLGADLGELRADYLSAPDLPRILAAKPMPVLVTVRPSWEGGRFAGPEPERRRLLEEAVRHGADYLDLEARAEFAIDPGRAKLILSWHDFEGTPDDLDAIHARIAEKRPSIVKIACQARGIADAVRLARLQRAHPGSAVIAMGDFGEPLRILYARYGGALTYAAVRAGGETAPGQLTVEDLVRRFHAKTVDGSTAVYGVVGNPVGHSKSPALFNDVFKHLHMNARYVRLKVDDPARLRDLVAALDVRGMSVTIPHKQAVMALLDEADDLAQGIGAANTLTAGPDGRLRGANTDLLASMEAIKDAPG